jgi:hypothetical protein
VSSFMNCSSHELHSAAARKSVDATRLTTRHAANLQWY